LLYNFIKKIKEKKLRERLPEFLKRPVIDTDKTREVRKILKVNCLNTVCENARCPNKNECYSAKTATFLIMGNVCTRNCRYCNISCAKPLPPDAEEPSRVACAIKALGLKYSVITSVTRDDLPDGGASHFAECIKEIRKISPDTKIEILTPDFRNEVVIRFIGRAVQKTQISAPSQIIKEISHVFSSLCRRLRREQRKRQIDSFRFLL